MLGFNAFSQGSWLAVGLALVVVAGCGGAASGGKNKGDAAAGGGATDGEGEAGAASIPRTPLPEGCRRLPTKLQTKLNDRVVDVMTCEFDRTTVTRTCIRDDGVDTTTWARMADAVSENRPLGTSRMDHAVSTIVHSDEESCAMTRKYTYDALGRLLTLVNTFEYTNLGCGSSDVAYDVWDDEGRPTHGTVTPAGEGAICGESEVQLSYDDEERTITIERFGSEKCPDSISVSTFDLDLLLTESTVDDDPAVITETLETEDICN